MKNNVIVILGPTGIGKSDLAIKLAKHLNSEIISADSMQIYKGLDIGTGKVTKEEQSIVKHHLLDIKEFNEEYSVKEFVDDAHIVINKLLQNKIIPIIIGGTGLYIKALVEGYTFYNTNKVIDIRQSINEMIDEKGLDYAYNKLIELDKNKAQKINKNDKKRIIRAFEILLSNNENSQGKINKNDVNYIIFALNMNRENLYKKINNRVDKMFSLGLEKEASHYLTLAKQKDFQSLKAIGYKEFKPYIDNLCDIESVKDSIKQNSRRYAKRQLTWLRGMNDIIWINIDETDAFENILSTLKNKEVI